MNTSNIWPAYATARFILAGCIFMLSRGIRVASQAESGAEPFGRAVAISTYGAALMGDVQVRYRTTSVHVCQILDIAPKQWANQKLSRSYGVNMGKSDCSSKYGLDRQVPPRSGPVCFEVRFYFDFLPQNFMVEGSEDLFGPRLVAPID